MPSTPIYQLRPPDVYPALETCSSGLSSVEADQRLALFGLNLLSEAQRPMPLRRLLGYLGYPLALALLATGLGAAVLGQLFLGLAIWALVLVNTAFSFWRNYRAEQAIDALRRLLPEYTRIFRDGQELHIPANRLVPGDVLVLGEGDNIPADARVVEEFGLRTNDTTLTGDAMPSRKTADASLRDGISELERPNLVFAGTSVVSGTGRAVVYSTGMLTQFGRIAHLTQTVSEAPSPMQVELQDFLRKVSWIAGGFALLVVLVGVLDAEVDLENLDAVLLGLGILVAAIPEGLPATLTLAMALAGQRLALKGVLVKKLSVLETLGTVSTLCTDKSGTLTQNQMTVRELWVAGQALQVSGVGYAPLGRIQPEPAGQPFESSLRQLLLALQACNNSRLTAPAAGKPSWGYIGDQTEAALRAAAVKGGVSEAELQRLPRVHELPFDARRKRMTTIHEPAGADAPARLAYVKGAPRELLAVCTQVLVDGQPQPLDEARRREALEQIDRCAGQALRVLGCACRRLPAGLRAYTPEAVERELTFLGLAAMHDPPRPEVTQAIGVLRQAGIRLIMVTGDYGLTALSLAQRVGMLGSQVQIVTGAELDLLDEAQLKELLGRPELLFARMAPEHKLRLVATLQLMGEVVAVTGDGVNDAPALRKADVGISMGIGGTDVAKEAADLVLTGDDFATVVDALREGRALYDNLRKSIGYILTSSVPEVLPFLLTAATHIPLALGMQQVLAIDLGANLLPGISLASEQPEPDVMQHPPRRRSRPVVDRSLLRRAMLWLGLLETGLCYLGYLAVFLLGGRLAPVWPWLAANLPPALAGLRLGDLEQLGQAELEQAALTAFYAGVVMCQLGSAFACRAEVNRTRRLGWLNNRLLVASVLAGLLQVAAVIYIPPLQRIFEHQPLPPALWLLIAAGGPALFSLEWVRKALVRARAAKTAPADQAGPADG